MFGPQERLDGRAARRQLSRSGLLGLCLLGLSLPAKGQGWPADSGPGGDTLRSSLRQFERLAPPPIEAGGRAERAVPDLAPTVLLPSGSVEVGMPAISAPASQDTALSRRPARRQEARRRSLAVPVTHASRDRERALVRELAARERRIRELERQLRPRPSR